MRGFLFFGLSLSLLVACGDDTGGSAGAGGGSTGTGNTAGQGGTGQGTGGDAAGQGGSGSGGASAASACNDVVEALIAMNETLGCTEEVNTVLYPCGGIPGSACQAEIHDAYVCELAGIEEANCECDEEGAVLRCDRDCDPEKAALDACAEGQ